MTINKPGIRIPLWCKFFLDRLSDEAAGGLFKALLHYGLVGLRDEVPDAALPLWMVLQGEIDRQDEQFAMGSYPIRYSGYRRWMEEKGEEPLDYHTWMTYFGIDDQEDTDLLTRGAVRPYTIVSDGYHIQHQQHPQHQLQPQPHPQTKSKKQKQKTKSILLI